ncbi:MAG: 2,3-diphosphoglycerate synthetase [Actinomycetota bacterium]|nr:2,3-diphosphoglycerate synthetase [Actinomycetota bacterium]
MGVVVAGGIEKLPAGGLKEVAGLPAEISDDPLAALDRAIARLKPEAVLDLSDEPVLDYRRRHEFASVALYREVAYEGADFRFEPPARPRVCESPSLAVVSTGKRTGKTAISAFTARRLKAAGRKPVIVAMGRGGPPDPEVIRGDEIELSPPDLLELADQGKHAASDYIEDALVGRVPTVGCRRCGGGLAGAVADSNVREGVKKANELGGDFIVLEGSGAAIPPVHADATVLVVPAGIPEEYVRGYLGPYKVLLADLVLVTMCENPFGTPSQISGLISRIRGAWRPSERKPEPTDEIQVVRTVFRPHPVRSVEGATAFVATTAPEAAAELIRRHLEREHGCRVAGISHSLSDRDRLEADLKEARGEADTLLCEIKAAGVDVATRRALDEGWDVVYMDNVPQGVEGDDPDAALLQAAETAILRYST